MRHRRKIHPLIKWVFTFFLLIFVPVYWVVRGPENFLWISDIALFFLWAALFFESSILASMAIVGDIAYALAWIVDFVYTLFAPSPGFTKYMLSSSLPLGFRVLSLFHIALPPMMLWAIRRLGYAPAAWRYQVVVSTVLLFVTWLVTNPEQNINFAFGYLYMGWQPFPYLILMALANSVVIFLTHAVLQRRR